MTSNSQLPSVEGDTMGDELFPVNLPNDEAGLSPTSKKILEKCAIPVTPVTLSRNFHITPTLISRPPNSGLDTGGFNFHFAKPKLPTPNFTSRSKTKLVGGIATPSNTPGVSINTSETNHPDKFTDSSSSGTPAHLKEHAANSRKTSPPKYPVAQGTKTLSGPNTEIPCVPKETACLSEHGYRDDDQLETDAPELGSDMADSNHLKTQGDPTRATSNARTSSPASSRSRSGEPNSAPPRSPAKDAKLRPKLMLNSKVVKQPMSPKPGINRTLTKQVTHRKESPFISQPPEEDLFYMLIHRLKKRDEMEAETAAMKERIEEEVFELIRANDNLRCKLRESELICKNQQEQLNARNSLVERWKVKFSKLRSFVTSVGNDFEVLRKEGQLLKSTQNSLFQEKDHIHEALKQMSNSTDQLRTRWSQHRETITGAQQEFNSLEKSLLVATTKVTDADKLISMERNRVATLENYINNYSDQHQKQAAEIEQKQCQTISKIDAIHKNLEGSWNLSQYTSKDEMESGFSSCISLLKSLSQQQTMKPHDLDKVESAIRDLSTRLNSSIEASKAMETAVDLHTNYGKRMSIQLTELETAVSSSTAVVGQLAETRELYGGLQEKLSTAEKNLTEVSADRDRLKSQESALHLHIGDLEIEISSLQKDKIEDTQFKDADMSSELQIQLEATSAALTESTYECKTKESEMHEMKLKLTETIEKLETAENEIADLKSEKFKIQDEAQRTEHRVREELTRANLAAKDQHRAGFEQERHKLKREKILAEKNAQKAAEELASLKCSMQAAEKCKHDLVTKMNQRQAEMDTLKMTASRRDSDISMEINEVKRLHASAITEIQSAQGQLEAVAKEKEELEHQLSELRINLAILQEQEPLQDTIEVLQYEIAEKDINLLSLKEELSKSEENTKRISMLQQEVADKSADIAILRERLDNILTANASMEESLKKKEDELITLNQKMEVSGKIAAETSTLNKDVEQKDNELAELRSRVQEANHLLENAENILRQLGIMGTGESLQDCSGALQSRLKVMEGGPEEKQAKEHTGSGLLIPMRTSSKRQGASRKRTMPSNHAECARPGSSTRERQTTELVYRTHSTREIISPTSKTPSSRRRNVNKRQPTTSGSFIRPFSQFQNDTTPGVHPREQTSPISELTDLNALFPSTPMNAKDLGVNQARTAGAQNHPQDDKPLLLTCDMDTTKERNVLSISNAVNNAMRAYSQPRGAIKPKELPGAMGSEPIPTTNAPNRCEVVNNVGVENKPCSPLRTSAGTLKRKEMPEDEMHAMEKEAGREKPPEKLPRKGILKDTAKLVSCTVESAAQTPPHEKNGENSIVASSKITFRRPSRKSKYFNPAMSPAASITARGGRCGSTANISSTPAGRTRERPRRRQRGKDTPILPRNEILIPTGDQYHNRFSQNTPV
ncbi:hypothetical protein EMCG_06075 [[Emmonsia] crescens]|uniref:Uncharacterized protein n=1 Tax=[Emmonsia] crescens TaxID=73230 RepID=A0A0G2IC65_9EURO|nr:hypothetical protein EMCG_06075 [Emmonsia crescens UAMH 3008]